MFLSSPRRPWAGPSRMVVACGLLAALGCNESADRRRVEAVAPPSPEERFESIVSALRRQIEDETLGDAAAVSSFDAPPGTPVTSVKVRVDSELTPPASEDEPYRAEICLVSDATVMVVLAPPSDDDVDEDKKKRREEIEKLEEELEGVADLDTLVTPIPQGASSKVTGTTVHEIKPDATERCYELEYQDDRWVLLTDLDPQNEPFYALAIEYAMKRQ